ncbi:non-hydrolyzing UDP-N-acetylglucosamine 2-epimerase [Halorubrum ezzemoulense]|uniref:non-hydrolyzing UDP-N-acetylglucosamine 2-epimerase n=1 Tax=Halorubrum ezzemoulense TaxID=337243 RepID=UPI00232D3D84|nr:UDP-N-acetylglucosamine 2-epimerase (non-hydrolyzing) [Halorubrum ezzemoulense]MDB9252924.1 UDP-N-acetylglucosamine 2-epimerase (non-hydrolyzing) [Halorubrum ezzemoulense]MDB9256692.1 UDP-N-acetylglucosamine 2-epimerase (non-hydrolyzing) [Halorubrum ezzemoulense]MDB9276999.1 UDP-N-acetylglucosamine 2-epimerase (non-hydrolyzing) [Halorubrum ezzemoulense]
MVDPEITFVLGTRPEIIKLAPVIRCCDRRDIPYSILHTGQHYSDELDTVFFDQLELPAPDYNLEVGSGRHGQQTAAMLAGIEEIILEDEPSVVFVQGDTNSVLAGALALSKLDIPVGHIEAGLRSFDRDMPEETNRVVADHVGDYLFAPTEHSQEYLRDEGIDHGRIFVTGNTIVDAVKQHRQLAREKSTVLEEMGVADKSYGLLTAHRAENVDVQERFEGLLEGVGRVASAFEMGVIYPIHPRAQAQLDELELTVPDSITVVESQDYLDFLQLEQDADLIMTDSGGVQEEACILGVPCVTLRDNTERPETVEVGANLLAGVDPEEILSCATQMVARETNWSNPFGSGDASDQILNSMLADGTSFGSNSDTTQE